MKKLVKENKELESLMKVLNKQVKDLKA